MTRGPALLLLSLLLSACKGPSKEGATPPKDGATPPVAATASASHETLPAAVPITAAPIYDLELTLVDQDGKSVGLDVYRGHPVIVSMFYASCPFACPTLISDIKRLERSLAPEAQRQLRVLLVSFDPERDSPEALRALARQHGLDAKRYKLAQAPETQVRELAAVLGIKYRKLDGGAFNHSSVITVLDTSGMARAHADGLNQPLEGLKNTLNELQGSGSKD
ncbi:MAG TPA: SCO family protein [Polyangiaceae bacterium]|nr:SCO family protein [Polyangiaceae bacterium]